MPRSICTYKSGTLCVFHLSAPLYCNRKGQEIVAVGEKKPKKKNRKQNKIRAEVRRQKQQTQSDFTGWMRGERSN